MSLPEVVLASRGMSVSWGKGWPIDACSIDGVRHRSVSELWGEYAVQVRPVSSLWCIYSMEKIGRTVAHWYRNDINSRKVRAPWERLPGNAWAPHSNTVTESATENKPPRKRQG